VLVRTTPPGPRPTPVASRWDDRDHALRRPGVRLGEGGAGRSVRAVNREELAGRTERGFPDLSISFQTFMTIACLLAAIGR